MFIKIFTENNILFNTNSLYFVVSAVLVVEVQVIELVSGIGCRIAKCRSSDSSVSEDSGLLGSWAVSTEKQLNASKELSYVEVSVTVC